MAKIVSEVNHQMARFFSETDKDISKKDANSKIGLQLCSASPAVAAHSVISCLHEETSSSRFDVSPPLLLVVVLGLFFGPELWPRSS